MTIATVRRSAFAVIAASFAAASLATGALAARAHTLAEAAGRYVIEPSSEVDFAVAQVGGGAIKGRFVIVSGVFTIDASNVAHSRVDVMLRPASIVTAEPRVTDFLKSSAVFDAAEYPVIRFRSFAIERTAADTAEIHGLLTARGKTREETFVATVTGLKPGHSITLHVTGAIYRAPFGMDVGVPIYSNVVQFDMLLHGREA